MWLYNCGAEANTYIYRYVYKSPLNSQTFHLMSFIILTNQHGHKIKDISYCLQYLKKLAFYSPLALHPGTHTEFREGQVSGEGVWVPPGNSILSM